MRQLLVVIGLSLVLLGCSSNQPRQQTWTHSTLNGQAAANKFVIDRGECDAVAANAVAVPASSGTTTGAQSSRSTSQFEMRSSSGQTYSGEIRSQSRSSSNGLEQGPLQGYIAGSQMAAESGRVQQAQQARQNMFASCMYRRGWTMSQ